MQSKLKDYLLYVISYFSLSLVSVGINKVFVLQPGVSPNIVVQILCVGYLVKKLAQDSVFSMKKKVTLPLLFGVVAVAFYVLMMSVFPEWKGQLRFWSETTLLAIFLFNYLVGSVVMMFLLTRWNRKNKRGC